MAVQVATRNPHFRVSFQLQDGTITKDVPLLHAALQEAILDIETDRRIGEAGTFQITMTFAQPPIGTPTSSGSLAESWADVITPMDYVQIALDDGNGFSVVMRGFVDAVGRTINLRSDRPARQIIILGRDFTKIVLNSKQYYLNGVPPRFDIMNTFNTGLAKLNPLNSKASTDAPATQLPGYKPVDIIGIVLQYFLQPQQEAMFPTAPPSGAITQSLFEGFDRDPDSNSLTTFTPVSNAEATAPFVSVLDLMGQYQHAPWYELFFDDYDRDGYLVFRPTPWLDRLGNYVMYPRGTDGLLTIAEIDIADADIIALELSRGDEQLANYFATYAALYGPVTQSMDALGSTLESFRSTGNPAIIGVDDSLNGPFSPSSFRRYGFRIRRMNTPYFDQPTQGKTQDDISNSLTTGRDIVARWNNKIVAAGDHEELLESGNITIKGNSKVHIGHYVRVGLDLKPRKPLSAPRYYVEGVGHKYHIPSTPNGQGDFETTLSVTRGRGYMARQLYLAP